MGALADLKRDLILENMTGAAGAASIDWADLANDSLADVPLNSLLVNDYSLPVGACAQSCSRFLGASANLATLVSQRATLVAMPLVKGMVINSITVHSGITAAVAPTAQRFGIYDVRGNKLATTVNDGATAWAAESIKTLALTSPFVVPSTDIYYVAILITAGTVPTLRGVGSNNYAGVSLAAITRLFRPGVVTDATNLADLPDPIGATAVSAAIPYVYVS